MHWPFTLPFERGGSVGQRRCLSKQKTKQIKELINRLNSTLVKTQKSKSEQRKCLQLHVKYMCKCRWGVNLKQTINLE